MDAARVVDPMLTQIKKEELVEHVEARSTLGALIQVVDDRKDARQQHEDAATEEDGHGVKSWLVRVVSEETR